MNEETASEENLQGQYENEILIDQVKQVYNLAPVGMMATLINGTIAFFVLQQGGMSRQLLIPWLAALVIATFLRMGLVLSFRARFKPDSTDIWRNRFLVGLILIGMVWGALGAFPFNGITPTQRVFIAFVLGGMASGAATTFSSLRWGYLAFAIPALVPIGINFLFQGEVINYAMGGMAILYLLLLWRLSEHNYRLNRTSLQLRFENRDMIDHLRQAEAALKEHRDHLERIVEVRTADLQRTNEELILTKIAAERSNQTKSEFLANMSHEIRTPLAGSMGMIDLVLGMDIGEEERQLLEMAKRSSESLLYLISDLLVFARIEAGTMRFEKTPFPVGRALETALEVVSITAREKGLRLSLQVAPGTPEILMGDESRIRQVLVNLLGNAVKFTEKGEITVSVRPVEDPATSGNHILLFSVRDTGIGISSDLLEKIFDKFTQVDSSTTRKYGGTGLGLALSRQIVEKLGGKIWAESTEAVGSTFFFTLPLNESLNHQILGR
ncbi:MAG: ATP-binding protein [Syntrophotaleaceae bacterium]